jgi:GTPase Era involved in 16S rRNA processing
MATDPTVTAMDAWAVCQAETLAENLERIDKAIFYYPRELHTAGKVRMAIMETIRELKEQAGVKHD